MEGPVGGAGPITTYSFNGCGTACAGGYDISLSGAQYSNAPEPASIALTGLSFTLIGIASQVVRRRKRAA
jgi:hypothetical protein